MSKMDWMANACGIFLLWAMASIALSAQTAVRVPPAQTKAVAPTVTFTSLFAFHGTTDGVAPIGVVQGTDGHFYGTTNYGGPNDGGTAFTIAPDGTLTTLYSFCSHLSGGTCTDGTLPYEVLVQGTDGNFYGTTSSGGNPSCNCGTVFKITPNGTLTTLYSFTGLGYPYAGLVLGADGNFYGTSTEGKGSVFKITPGGAFTTLHEFDGTDGETPGPLILASNGSFYGATFSGGTSHLCAGGCGTVFAITPSGTLTTLASFDDTDGYGPAALIQTTNGNFYGTTQYGGAYDTCNQGCGTVFKMTPNGILTTLHSFDGADGDLPFPALLQGTDGNLYGEAVGGGANDLGTVYSITPGGTLTTLHNFDETDGNNPIQMVQGTNGTFYGTTQFGGANNDGTVFSLSVGLGPFVETQPASGSVGAAVNILGTNLTGATAVAFNGTPAVFTVVSHSLITTTVPTGATSGKVQVTVPNGTLRSNGPFRVN
jgi:uncharacterized repeat protein (TIGR03803 family)